MMINSSINSPEIVIILKSEIRDTETIPLLKILNLRKYFPVERGFFQQIFSRKKEQVHAVDDISFSIKRGEVFCLVGESGCGKTTAANVLVGLEKPTSGIFRWKGEEISHKELKPKKENIKSQIVFQNPYTALNPRMRLGDAVLHTQIIHNRLEDKNTKKKLRNAYLSEGFLYLGSIISLILMIFAFLIEGRGAEVYVMSSLGLFTTGIVIYAYYSLIQKKKIADPSVLKLFDEIGLTPSIQYYKKFPHEVSGGEKQRVSIVRALIMNPELLIADEPTSMLDVSLRAGILDSIKTLQLSYNLSILFITHDLATARHFGDRVGVMYVGKLVEIGEVDAIFQKPLHPYTKALIEAIPTPIPGEKNLNLPKGEVADTISPPSGCRYHPRCPIAELSLCSVEQPPLKEEAPNHWVACHFAKNFV